MGPSRAPSPGFSCARRGRWCAHSLTSRARLRASVELHPAGRGRECGAVAPRICTTRVPAPARGRDRSAGGTHAPPPRLPPPPSRAARKRVHPLRTAPPPAGGGVASAARCQANRRRGLPLACPAPRAVAGPLASAHFPLVNSDRRTYKQSNNNRRGRGRGCVRAAVPHALLAPETVALHCA